MQIPDDHVHSVKQRLAQGFGAVPVLLDDALADRHYNGFCNSILWPLLHYQPDAMVFDKHAWIAYCEVNLCFAQTIAADIQDGDLVWIHDYHLMLLPALLRKVIGEHRNVRIGFFLHTPFPCMDVFRMLPVHRQLLEGMLNCDLVGFHTTDYRRHFLCSCAHILELDATPHTVMLHGRAVSVGVFPIGIDPPKFEDSLSKPHVQRRIASLEQEFRDVKVMIGVDRLDYIKGLPQKLHALDLFLTEHPEWIGKVVLIQVAVPSREGVEEYRHLQTMVNELVGRVNGKFGTVGYSPIHFLHHSVDFDELVALYSVSDVCLISSTRDRMNLVAYEYVACQQGRDHTLVLSEFAGAADTMLDCLKVNPWDTNHFSAAIHKALHKEKTSDSFSAHEEHVHHNTSASWGREFVRQLERPISPVQRDLSRRWDPRDGFDGSDDSVS